MNAVKVSRLLLHIGTEKTGTTAWQAWLAHQTMLINEKHLSLMDPEARKYLMGEMDKFLAGEDFDQAEGYVPPAE